MINNYVTNLQANTFGFSSVTTSATPGTYTQLPSIICDEVVFTRVPTAGGAPVLCATSATPGNNALYVATASDATPVTIPTGQARNANVLFLTNEAAAAGAQVVGFMWKAYDNNHAPFPTNRGAAG